MKGKIRLAKQGTPYDVVVVGGGHAGVEAALAASRMGADTLLITGNLDTIAKMSCNPAIGGQAKGHIVREIDAMGGEMGVCADATAIQFRVLNASKGWAVQSPRAQCDKAIYALRMKQICEAAPSLSIFQAIVVDFEENKDEFLIKTQMGISFSGKSLVLTTGTFLNGKLFVGRNTGVGGRLGDFCSQDLPTGLHRVGFEMGRMKTGTPARILGASIDFSLCDEQKSDKEPVFFGFYDTRTKEDMFHVEQNCKKIGWIPGQDMLSCWLTATGDGTRGAVSRYLDQSPLYSGMIEGAGARYCPSIEDKFVKFPDKETHRLFLEPEGRYSDEWYVNGLSTSLPIEAQMELFASVPALKNAVMLRPAYAIEYDFINPTQLFQTLETKKVENLFLAGQINGTSGYEEAGIQGLVAGANAAAKVLGLREIVLGRDSGYGGVLIDDLVTKGVDEPYRMFTSRAEYRLLFNHGSSEIRLLEKIEGTGLLSVKREAAIRKKRDSIDYWSQHFEEITISGGYMGDVLRRDFDAGVKKLPEEFVALSKEIKDEVLYRVRYRGYLEREAKAVSRMKDLERVLLPDNLDYMSLMGLSIEARQKLTKIRPKNLSQAEHIAGVSPADISLLMISLRSK